ncbi:MAG: hypothetical protein J6Q94_05010 [Clostridia bacterium]|nr:hypothetical protein [Clostridia bacterium]
MIDKNGNKISSEQSQPDPDFIFNEIRFFEKAFIKDQNDTRALNIARQITTFLKAKDNSNKIIAILTNLEKYATATNSEDFLWELVNIRRTLADISASSKIDTADSLYIAADYRHIAANIFKEIVRVNPSVYNRCAEVIEFVTASRYYKEANSLKATSNILERTQILFENIEETNTEKYYDAGESLYLDIICNSDRVKSTEDKLKYYLKLIHCSRELYKINKNKTSLNIVASAYIDCLDYEQFSYENEKENINDAILMLEEAIKNGNSSMERKLKKLTDAVNKRQNNT